MPTVTYDSPRSGGYELTVPRERADLGVGGGPMGDLGWLEAIARKSAILKGKKSKLEYDMMKRESERPEPTEDRFDRDLRQATASTEMARQRRMLGAAPMKWHSNLGAGTTANMTAGGYLPDYALATGIERELFAPKEARFEGEQVTPSEMERAERGMSRVRMDEAQGMAEFARANPDLFPSQPAPRTVGGVGGSGSYGGGGGSVEGRGGGGDAASGGGGSATSSYDPYAPVTPKIRPASYYPSPTRKRPMTRGGQPDLFSTNVVRA